MSESNFNKRPRSESAQVTTPTTPEEPKLSLSEITSDAQTRMKELSSENERLDKRINALPVEGNLDELITLIDQFLGARAEYKALASGKSLNEAREVGEACVRDRQEKRRQRSEEEAHVIKMTPDEVEKIISSLII